MWGSCPGGTCPGSDYSGNNFLGSKIHGALVLGEISMGILFVVFAQWGTILGKLSEKNFMGAVAQGESVNGNCPGKIS